LKEIRLALIRGIGFVLMIFGIILLGYSDYSGFLFLIVGVPLIFYDLISYYIKLKIFFKLNQENESERYQSNAPRVRKPRRPKI
jgi:hypothetical protein